MKQKTRPDPKVGKQLAQVFIKSGQNLQEGDLLAFIPISGGG